jgi:hypothetical protein
LNTICVKFSISIDQKQIKTELNQRHLLTTHMCQLDKMTPACIIAPCPPPLLRMGTLETKRVQIVCISSP